MASRSLAVGIRSTAVRLLWLTGQKIPREKQAETLSFVEIQEILRRSEELLLSEPTLLEFDAPVSVVGKLYLELYEVRSVLFCESIFTWLFDSSYVFQIWSLCFHHWLSQRRLRCYHSTQVQIQVIPTTPTILQTHFILLSKQIRLGSDMISWRSCLLFNQEKITSYLLNFMLV